MGTAVDLVLVPYDSGHRGRRVGAGPEALVEAGLEGRLAAAGLETRLETVELAAAGEAGGFTTEVAAAVELQNGVARAVRRCVAEGRMPIVLAGNCNGAALGVLGGLAPERPAIAWFDAHGDLNTPETSPSGFFDGMALAVATGRCWSGIRDRLDGFEPVADESVALIAARDLDPAEREILHASSIAAMSGTDRSEIEAQIARWRQADGVYLHVDLDALDPAVLRPNPWVAPGGLARSELVGAIELLATGLDLRALAFTAYSPEHDEPERACNLVAEAALAALGGSSRFVG